MRDKRQRILDDPEGHRQEQIKNKLPDDFEDLLDTEQEKIIGDLGGKITA